MTMTPADRARLDQNKAAVDEELDGMIAYWRLIVESGCGPDAALIGVTQALVDSLPSQNELLRLVAFAVGRLADLPAVTS